MFDDCVCKSTRNEMHILVPGRSTGISKQSAWTLQRKYYIWYWPWSVVCVFSMLLTFYYFGLCACLPWCTTSFHGDRHPGAILIGSDEEILDYTART